MGRKFYRRQTESNAKVDDELKSMAFFRIDRMQTTGEIRPTSGVQGRRASP
jgi:hypothetical protein